MSIIRYMMIQDPSNSGRLAKLGTLLKHLVTMDVENEEVDAGHAFRCSSVDLTMGDTDAITLSFKTPAGTTRTHLTTTFTTLIGGHVDILEGSTWTQGTGTTVPIYNRKREASMDSSILLENRNQADFTASDVLMLGVTITGSGTIVYTRYSFAVKNQDSAGATQASNKYILKPDTQYTIRFTADGAANKGELVLNWTECPDE